MAKKIKNKFATVPTETAEAAAPVAEEVKEEPKEVKAAETKPKAEKKTAVKAAEDKKAEDKKAEEKKPAEKKVTDKKSAEKKEDKFIVQFAGFEYDTADIIEKCKAAYKADNSRKQVRTLEVYLKPDEKKAYYVVNGKADGLFIEL